MNGNSDAEQTVNALLQVTLSESEPVLPNNSVTSTQRVYDAVVELRSSGMLACRDTIADLTGLKLSVIDDRLRHLKDFDKKIVRLNRGFYELVEHFPAPRASSVSVLSNKYVKVEVGDDVWTLTPAEACNIGLGMAGFAHRAVVVDHTREHLMLASDLAARVGKLERELKAYKAHKGGDSPQLDWVSGQ